MALAAFMLICLAGCSPDEYSLGDKNITADDLVEGVAYTITHDSNNPNIVYLKSLLPERYTVLWDEPAGRSQEREVTLKLPFAGTYKVRMGVETRAGIVYGPECTFTIENFCSDFVSGEMWENLTGGVGSTKRWYLDLDAEGTCRYFVGPLYFYGTDENWNSVTLGQPASGDAWSWAADWAGNGSWLFGSTGAMDYGYMEFSLAGGATVTVQDNAAGRTFNGTFTMDTDNHTLKLTDAPVLHDPGREAIVSQWGSAVILALDENHMQLAVLRDSDPNEGPCLLSYNFISEDYRNNWSPEVVDNTDVTPVLPDDWRDYLEPKTQKQSKYKLADEEPYWFSGADGVKLSSATVPEALSDVSDLTLSFNRGDASYQITTPAGITASGNYTLSDDGIYTFNGEVPVAQLSKNGEVCFQASANNSLRILGYTIDDYSGNLNDLYLGKALIDDQGKVFQYVTYHFVQQTAGSADVVRYTAQLNLMDNVSWVLTQSDKVFITGDGEYTLTVNGSRSDVNILYLQIDKLLKDHPEADVIVTAIKADGKDVPFSDTEGILRCVDDGSDENAKYNARRYFLNPWNVDGTMDPSLFVYTSSLAITIKVIYDSGSVNFN